MADKLSDRLEREAARTKPAWTKAPTMNPPTKPVHDARVQALLREAAELARRVEGAPVRMVGEAISYGVSAAGTGISNGQRVRLVPEPPEVPHVRR